MEPSEIKTALGGMADSCKVQGWNGEEESLNAALEYIETLEEAIEVHRQKARDGEWASDRLQERLVKAEAEREKADLVAWGLLNYAKNRLNCICKYDNWHLYEERDENGKVPPGRNLGPGVDPILTDEDFAILRAARAREKENG